MVMLVWIFCIFIYYCSLNTAGISYLKIINASEVIKFTTSTILIPTQILYDISYLDDVWLFIL